MRQAASAAIDLYYAGITDKKIAEKNGLSWVDGGNEGSNAYGAYDPTTGTFYKNRDSLPSSVSSYGKGTTVNGGTNWTSGNDNGSYLDALEYRDAVVLVSIFPKANPAHVDVYWKNNKGKDKNKYVGGQSAPNIPKYSMRLNLN